MSEISKVYAKVHHYVQQQANWEQTDENAVDYIKNKDRVNNRIGSLETEMQNLFENVIPLLINRIEVLEQQAAPK